MKCCICGREKRDDEVFHNPTGAVDETKKVIQWNESDHCCDECNTKYVLPGRLYKFYRVIKNESLVRREACK